MKTKQIVGAFQLGNTIGQGTFGKVKLGRHILTQEDVAVKIFEKDKLDRPGDVKRILKEISILKELNHPHIIRIFQIVETPSHLYFIMEYVEKGELFQHIKNTRRLTQKMAAKLFYQLVSAIEYMHSLNVVHRDLKPQNILLTSNMDIKIVDFGLSTHFQDECKLKSSCGSPCYALPQMLVGQRYTAQEADVWSSGVVLFTMICGFLPYEDNDIKRLYQKIMTQQLQFVEEASTQVRDLIQNILNKQRQKRWKLKDVKFHPWLVKYNRQQLITLQPKYTIDDNVLREMEVYGVESTYARQCLQSHKFNFATTLYYLLQKKIARDGVHHINSSTLVSIKDRLLQQSDSFEFNLKEGMKSQFNQFVRESVGKQISSIDSNFKPKKKFNKSQSPAKARGKQKSNSQKNLLLTSRSKLDQDTPKRVREGSQNQMRTSAKKNSRNEQYFIGRKSKDKLSKKKISMYEKMQGDCSEVFNCQYEQVMPKKMIKPPLPKKL